jgi:hypothetical protein
MRFDLSYDEVNDIIIGNLTGNYHAPTFKSFSLEMALIAQKHNCYNLLTNVIKLDIKPTMFETFFIPEITNEAGIQRTVKRAVLLDCTFIDYEFLKTVETNNGHNIKMFETMDKAIEWLKDRP